MPTPRSNKPKTLPPSSIKVKTVKESEEKGLQFTTWVLRTVEMMKKGHTMMVVKDMIAQNIGDKKVSPGYIAGIISEANKILSQEFSTNRKHVEGLHLRRYNNSINRLLAVSEGDYEDPDEGRRAQITAFMQALDTLYQKEKLLQFHSKNFKIEINNETNINVDNTPKKGPVIDISKLSFEEKVELYELMKAARKEDEAEYMDDVIDVEAEVVTEEEKVIEEPNIAKIKTISRGIDEDKPKTVTVDDPIAKLKASLRKQAVKEFEKANANLDKDEVQQLPKRKTNRK